MSPVIQAILASTLSSVFGLAGGFLLLWQQSWVRHFSKYFVSFAAGALLGAAFFDVLTEALAERGGSTVFVFTWVTVGFLLFFLIEKFLLWHHHTHNHEAEERVNVVIPLIIVGDAIHNFIDGTIIAATFFINPGLGLATALAVFFHEIPQEIGDFSIMIHSGMARRAVVLWNILGALVSPLGAVLTIIIADQTKTILLPLLGLAAGNFLYIAAADLIPEIHREQRVGRMAIQFGLFVIGILTIVQLAKLFPA